MPKCLCHHIHTHACTRTLTHSHSRTHTGTRTHIHTHATHLTINHNMNTCTCIYTYFLFLSFSVFISIRSDNVFSGSYYNGFPPTLTALFERTYDSDAPSCFFTNVSYDELATSLLSESFFDAAPYLPSNVFTEENRHVRNSPPPHHSHTSVQFQY